MRINNQKKQKCNKFNKPDLIKIDKFKTKTEDN